jgi:hypothetical protein
MFGVVVGSVLVDVTGAAVGVSVTEVGSGRVSGGVDAQAATKMATRMSTII